MNKIENPVLEVVFAWELQNLVVDPVSEVEKISNMATANSVFHYAVINKKRNLNAVNIMSILRRNEFNSHKTNLFL